MPLMTRTLGRAVSLLDYEDFARAFAGVAKAQRRCCSCCAGPTIAITIAAAGGAPICARRVRSGSTSPRRWPASGDPHVAVRLLAHQREHLPRSA